MQSSCFIARRQRLGFLSLLLLAGFSLSASYHADVGGKLETQSLVAVEQKTRKPSPKPSPVAVRITKIDGNPVKTGEIPQVGKDVDVEGTIPDPKMIACMAVRPIMGNTWWVQNDPGPPDQVDKQTWRILATVFCGTENLGKNERYQIVILSESTRSYCVPGKKFQTSEFPNQLPRSEIITIRRTKD